jgi:transposase
MQTVADRSEAPNAIRTDLGAIFVSLELSRSRWLITSLSPDGGEKMSKHAVRGGDVAGLLERFAQLRKKARARTGKVFPFIVIQEAGLDGFWIDRLLRKEGIESHVVDPASITTSRRRRRAKTDGIDGEAPVRALLAYKRGEPRVCAMVKAPTPEEEDRRRLCRERKVLIGERVRHVNRVKGLLFSQGISYEPLRHDRRERLDTLQTGDGRLLPDHLKAQVRRELDRLELLLEQIKAVEAERDALLAVQQGAAPAPAAMLLNIKGIGPEFAAILWSEGLFRHFDNRRQVASYAGLAPTPWQSGSVDREQGVSKAGNPRLRKHSSNSPGYGCAISRNRRWLCGSKSGSTAMAAVSSPLRRLASMSKEIGIDALRKPNVAAVATNNDRCARCPRLLPALNHSPYIDSQRSRRSGEASGTCIFEG